MGETERKELDPRVREEIASIVRRVNTERGSAIPILQAVQEQLGHVSPEMVAEISANTGIPAAELFGIATFYSQFHLEPRGKNIVRVCHGTACHLAGADKVTHAVEMATGGKEGGTSPDGEFTVERVACLGCCSLAPVVMVNEDVLTHVKTDRIASLLKKYVTSTKKVEKPDSEVTHNA